MTKCWGSRRADERFEDKWEWFAGNQVYVHDDNIYNVYCQNPWKTCFIMYVMVTIINIFFDTHFKTHADCVWSKVNGSLNHQIIPYIQSRPLEAASWVYLQVYRVDNIICVYLKIRCKLIKSKLPPALLYPNSTKGERGGKGGRPGREGEDI